MYNVLVYISYLFSLDEDVLDTLYFSFYKPDTPIAWDELDDIS